MCPSKADLVFWSTSARKLTPTAYGVLLCVLYGMWHLNVAPEKASIKDNSGAGGGVVAAGQDIISAALLHRHGIGIKHQQTGTTGPRREAP